MSSYTTRRDHYRVYTNINSDLLSLKSPIRLWSNNITFLFWSGVGTSIFTLKFILLTYKAWWSLNYCFYLYFNIWEVTFTVSLLNQKVLVPSSKLTSIILWRRPIWAKIVHCSPIVHRTPCGILPKTLKPNIDHHRRTFSVNPQFHINMGWTEDIEGQKDIN